MLVGPAVFVGDLEGTLVVGSVGLMLGCGLGGAVAIYSVGLDVVAAFGIIVNWIEGATSALVRVASRAQHSSSSSSGRRKNR
jgi:hypothetical protein